MKSSKAINTFPIRNILKSVTLRDYQAESSLMMAESSRLILIDSTGMGKTITCLAGLQMRFNSKRSKKMLWIGLLSSLSQVVQTIREQTNFRVSAVMGNEIALRGYGKKNPVSCDITVVNIEAFDNNEIIRLFKAFSHYSLFDTVVIDEAHNIANPFSSNRNSFIYMLAYRIQNVYLLTATPLISRVDQYASLIALATKDLPNLIGLRQDVHLGHYKPENAESLVRYKSRDETIPIEVHLVKQYKQLSGPTYGVALFKETRGADALEINKELIKIIKGYDIDSHFLVHCHLTEHHEFLRKYLTEELGIRVGVVSSKQNDKNRFNNRELDCIIFSISEGLNMPADFTILYDWTIYATQIMGRGLRQQSVDNYKVHILISDNEKELKLCENTVIKNGLLTDKALGFNPLKQLIGGFYNAKFNTEI